MKKLLLFLLLLPLALQAQEVSESSTVTVSGRVISNSGETLPGANIYLVNRQDTLQQFGVSSGNDGSFTLSIPPALYRMRVSYVGYRSHTAELEATKDVRLPDISLEENSQVLDALTVTGRSVIYSAEGYVANVAANKQLQQLPLDRMLAFLPGMYVDRENIKVYMNNVSQVYINDRLVRMSGQELIDHLKAYDGKNIQKIEVIVNNGVEHAASSFGASSIRITTVKVIEGGMVSVNAVASYNKQSRDLGNPYGNLLWRHGNWSFNLNASGKTYSRNKNWNSYETHYLDSDMTTFTNSLTRNNLPLYTPIRLSIGYDLDKNNLLTINSSYSTRKNIIESSQLSCYEQENNVTESQSQWNNENRSRQASTYIEYVHRVKDGRISANVSYGKSWGDSWQQSDVLLTDSHGYGLTDGRSDNETYSAGIHFTRRYKNDKEQLKLGGSFSSWSNESHTVAKQYMDDVLQEFGSYTDLYHYRELNYALYASYDMRIGKKINLQMGIRMEHLRVYPESMVNPEENHESNYTNLFPNVAFNYVINRERGHNLNLSYARSINPPNMYDLNPIMIWQNEYTYRVGNPYLEPTFGHQINMRMNLFGNYSAVVQYIDSKTRQTVYEEDANGLLYSMPQNGGKEQQLSASLGVSIMSVKNLMLNASASYTYYRARYESLRNSSSAWSFLVKGNYSLPWNLNLDADLMYMIPEKGIYMSLQKSYTFSVYLSRSFFEDWNVGIGYTYSSPMDMNIHSTNYIQKSLSNSTPHTFTLNIGYSFKWGEWLKVRRMESGNVLNRIGD